MLFRNTVEDTLLRGAAATTLNAAKFVAQSDRARSIILYVRRTGQEAQRVVFLMKRRSYLAFAAKR